MTFSRFSAVRAGSFFSFQRYHASINGSFISRDVQEPWPVNCGKWQAEVVPQGPTHSFWKWDDGGDGRCCFGALGE